MEKCVSPLVNSLSMKNHHLYGVSQAFLWPCSIAFGMFTRYNTRPLVLSQWSFKLVKDVRRESNVLPVALVPLLRVVRTVRMVPPVWPVMFVFMVALAAAANLNSAKVCQGRKTSFLHRTTTHHIYIVYISILKITVSPNQSRHRMMKNWESLGFESS